MSDLIKKLPSVEGRLLENVPMAKRTWLKVGGPLEVLFMPDGEYDLISFLKACPQDIPVTVIGATSNLLIRDGGIPGVTIQLGQAFAGVSTSGATLTAGCGTSCTALSEAAAKAGIAGLEFLTGIPGLVGGAIAMNAGAHGMDVSKVLSAAIAIDRDGNRHEMGVPDLRCSYRHCDAAATHIFTQAIFRGTPDETLDIRDRMAKIKMQRETTQPIHEATAGSTFKNPPGAKAWELIKQAGCGDMRVGGAHMSPLHLNFMINDGTATAQDCEKLGEAIREHVLHQTGVKLEWEIQIVGVNK